MSAELKAGAPDLLYVGRTHIAAQIGELTRVALVEPVTAEDGFLLPAGCVGTVVGVWGRGEGFDVEFTSPVAALVTVGPSAIRSA